MEGGSGPSASSMKDALEMLVLSRVFTLKTSYLKA